MLSPRSPVNGLLDGACTVYLRPTSLRGVLTCSTWRVRDGKVSQLRVMPVGGTGVVVMGDASFGVTNARIYQPWASWDLGTVLYD